MKKLLKFAVCLAILVMVVALFTGCKATGGGWFIDRCGEGNKCTFGFVAQGDCDDFKGQLQFIEHNGKDSTKFHVDDMRLVLVAGPVAYFEGLDDGDMVKVMVTDLGEPGTAGIGDLIAIDHDGLGKKWAGAIDGGNIQVH